MRAGGHRPSHPGQPRVRRHKISTTQRQDLLRWAIMSEGPAARDRETIRTGIADRKILVETTIVS